MKYTWNRIEITFEIECEREPKRGPTGDRCKTKIEINMIIYYPRYPILIFNESHN